MLILLLVWIPDFPGCGWGMEWRVWVLEGVLYIQ